MTGTIIIIGGYGVFGGRLARRLALQRANRVVVAGRDSARAKAFCRETSMAPAQCDRTDRASLDRLFACEKPEIVIDAAGPYTWDGTADSYRVAHAALSARSHYMDLADDPDFVENITMLDRSARRAGRCVLSGVSSVPCLSSSVIEDLARPMETIDTIDTAILPGNRAPRGRSVMESILSRTGQPFHQWENGQIAKRRNWGSLSVRVLRIEGLKPLAPRWVSPIEVPDQRLFSQRYGARTVRFSAGLELGLMHWGLVALSAMVRLGLMKNPASLTRLLHRIADALEPFGTDRGGMVVTVAGTGKDAQPMCRRWTLIAEAGDGPQVPAMPALAVIHALDHDQLQAGARPAMGIVPLSQIENEFAPFAISTAITSQAVNQSEKRKSGRDWNALRNASPHPLEIDKK